MITILSGTNRPGSNTRKVASVVEGLYRDLGAPARVLDLQDLPPELFLPSAYASKPPAFSPFAQAVLDSSGVVIVTPEYNGSFPGVLKVFIDHLKFPESFEGRPVCFIGLAAGVWGALRAVEQLQAIFGYRNAHMFPKRVFLPGVAAAFDAQGEFTHADWRKRLREQAAEYVSFVETMHGIRLRPESGNPA